MFEIMLNDLKPEAQKAFLKYMGIKNPPEGNYEVVPIAMIDYNDGEGEADEVVCLVEGNYTEEPDGCLLVDPDIDFGEDETVDVCFEDRYPYHYARYRVLMTKGDFGETILSPTGYEYDDEPDEDEDEMVTSREVDCPCDCSDCEWADKCVENGRYDFSDDEEEGGE